MRSLFRNLLAGAVLGLLLPGVLLTMAVHQLPAPTEAASTEETGEPIRIRIPVLVRDNTGQVQQMDMDTYIEGVVLAEMPASFEMEALKAQSVAARTFARKAYVTGGKHKDGSVCCDSACCQAYTTEEKYLDRGGAPLGPARIRAAVEATSGYVLTYEGKLIEATYYSCSGGTTEDAQAVWGTDFPYLRSVDSPGEEKATHYTSTFSFSQSDFCEKLGVKPQGSAEKWFRDVTYTNGGGIRTMRIGDQIFTGPQLRSALKLDSTALSITTEGDTITITTRGYGHRVGMSQYGADAMAVAGSTWQEILAHYYPGTSAVRLTEE